MQILEDKETKPLVSDCYHIFTTISLMSLNELKKSSIWKILKTVYVLPS